MLPQEPLWKQIRGVSHKDVSMMFLGVLFDAESHFGRLSFLFLRTLIVSFTLVFGSLRSLMSGSPQTLVLMCGGVMLTVTFIGPIVLSLVLCIGI